MPPTDTLLGREMRFKTGPCFEPLLSTLLVMCESGETRCSLELFTQCTEGLEGGGGGGGGGGEVLHQVK